MAFTVHGKEKNGPLMKAIVINAVALLCILFFFEIGACVDDLMPASILYGAYTGEYETYLLYSNRILAWILVSLLKLCPHVGWYFVISILGMWLAFTTITMAVIRLTNAKVTPILLLFLFLPAYHDFITRINFGKTAALLICAGLCIIFMSIETSDYKPRYWIWGLFLIEFGSLIRNIVLYMVILVFSGIFFVYCKRAIQTGDVAAKRKIRQLIYGVLLIVFTNIAINFFSGYAIKIDDKWHDFLKINSARASIQDFAIPNYREYQKEYEALGISYNDYQVYWKNRFLCYDPQRYTTDMLNSVRRFEDKSKYLLDSLSGTMLNITRELLLKLRNCQQFIPLISCIILAYLNTKKQKRELFWANIGGIIALFYLIWNGRTTPDVLTAIAFAMLTVNVLLFFKNGNLSSLNKMTFYKVAIIVSILTIWCDYNKISTSGYYVKESYEEAGVEPPNSIIELTKQMTDAEELISGDENHVYLNFEIIGRPRWFMYYDIWKAQMPNTKKNMVVMYDFGVQKEQLKKYDIVNPWEEITDSKNIYVLLHDTEEAYINNVTTYIQEHYDKHATAVLIKDVNDMLVYRFISDPQKKPFDDKNLIDGTDIIREQMSIKKTENGYELSGYAYIEGEDSYAQNICVKMVDKESGATIYQYLTQTENKYLRDAGKNQGRYSACKGEIDFLAPFSDVEMYMYLITDTNIYTKQIK